MADIRVERLRKTFGPIVALDDVDFSFTDSQVTCLLGPSGCGKTTLMRIIAGLEQPTAGDVYFGDRRVTDLPPRKREIGMVFQYPVVYKGIDVRRNIELPLLSQKMAGAERRRRVDEVIELLGLGPSASLDVSRLDNGTRQKVAVAREVARQPRIILFDEPITNVDAAAKLQLKRAFKELTRRLNQTIVYVTHDQTEAMTLADQIALMRDGQIVQCDAPRALYNHPADRFGGWFLGNPGMVFVDTRLGSDPAGGVAIASPLFPAPVPLSRVDGDTPEEITIGIRPEQIRLAPERTPRSVPGRVARTSVQIGGQLLVTLRLDELPGQTLKAKVGPDAAGSIHKGNRIWVEVPTEHVTLFAPNGHRLVATPTGADTPSGG